MRIEANLNPECPMCPRCQILVEYAKWTTRAAVNRGQIKKTEAVYELLDEVAFADVLSGAKITQSEFDRWHERETKRLCKRAVKHLSSTKLSAGWSTKLINVFLKTAVYAGGIGHDSLLDVIHPPLDNGLKRGIRKHFKKLDRVIYDKVNFKSIIGIKTYRDYQSVIDGCREASRKEGCRLIEVEQFAGLGLRKDGKPPGNLAKAICPE